MAKSCETKAKPFPNRNAFWGRTSLCCPSWARVNLLQLGSHAAQCAATPTGVVRQLPLWIWKTSAPAHYSGLEPNRTYTRPREGGTHTNTLAIRICWCGLAGKWRARPHKEDSIAKNYREVVSLTTWSSQPAENIKPVFKTHSVVLTTEKQRHWDPNSLQQHSQPSEWMLWPFHTVHVMMTPQPWHYHCCFVTNSASIIM